MRECFNDLNRYVEILLRENRYLCVQFRIKALLHEPDWYYKSSAIDAQASDWALKYFSFGQTSNKFDLDLGVQILE